MRSAPGRLSLGLLLFLLLLVAGIYTGFKLAPPYWEYYSLKEAAPPYRDADVKEAVLQKAKYLGVPLTESDLAVFRDQAAVSIEFSWVREVPLPGRIVRFSFSIKDSEPIH
jgi:hypothetical protein